jgi:hypothetical protein
MYLPSSCLMCPSTLFSPLSWLHLGEIWQWIGIVKLFAFKGTKSRKMFELLIFHKRIWHSWAFNKNFLYFLRFTHGPGSLQKLQVTRHGFPKYLYWRLIKEHLCVDRWTKKRVECVIEPRRLFPQICFI